MDRQPVRLIIVDDHPTIREGLRSAASAAGVELVAAVGDIPSAMRAATELRADVVVCDLLFGTHPDGLRFLEWSRMLPTKLAVIVLSAYDQPSLVRRAIELGAAGFLRKSATPTSIVGAVERAARGERTFEPAVLQVMHAAPDLPSARELEVIRLLVKGLSNDEIGRSLGLSTKTIESHLRRLFRRYACVGRVELVNCAQRNGWLLVSQ